MIRCRSRNGDCRGQRQYTEGGQMSRQSQRDQSAERHRAQRRLVDMLLPRRAAASYYPARAETRQQQQAGLDEHANARLKESLTLNRQRGSKDGPVAHCSLSSFLAFSLIISRRRSSSSREIDSFLSRCDIRLTTEP